MLDKKIKKIISIGIVIGLMLIIFKLSNQDAVESRNISDRFVHSYRKMIRHIPYIPREIKCILFREASHYIRKIAHVVIYALLGLSSLVVFWQLPIKTKKAWWLALLTCTIYAITDEWHQYYVAGRGAGWSDVLLDSVGALIGIGIGCLIRKIVYRIILNKKVEKRC